MHVSRLALALAILAPAGPGLIAAIAAQQTDRVEPQTRDELVDFVMRPTQAADEEDVWNPKPAPPPPPLEAPIGPPMAGPTGDEPIGPPLAGPAPQPIEDGKIRAPRPLETDPFAPVGIKLGSFIIRPAIEVGGIFTDNARETPDKESAIGVVFAPEIAVVSEDERYRFEADARAEIISYDKEEFDENTAAARAKYRYDLSSLTSINVDAGYQHFLESFTDPDTPSAAAERPGVNEFDATLGVEQRFGPFSARLSGFANREIHDEVQLAGGGTASLEELNNTEFGGRLRFGYATNATLRPFVEAAVGGRAFDESRDDSGFARDGVWGELRGGLVVERGDKLSGEISLGFHHEDLEDDRLEDLDVLLANAALLWSPQRLSEVRVDLSTEIDPTTTPDVSASVVYAGTLTLSHSFTPRVRGEVGFSVSHEHEIGGDFRELILTGFTGASYAFNRVASIEARYTYQRTDRTAPDENFDEHEVGVRLRLQR